jgi:hypothetical protein
VGPVLANYFFKTTMRIAPAATGGGAGFVTATSGIEFAQIQQTSATYQNIRFSSRM